MPINKDPQLVAARHAIGLYSIEEIRQLFARTEDGKPMGRHVIDFAMNSGKLRYISPNNRDRYAYLTDVLECMSSMSQLQNEMAEARQQAEAESQPKGSIKLGGNRK